MEDVRSGFPRATQEYVARCGAPGGCSGCRARARGWKSQLVHGEGCKNAITEEIMTDGDLEHLVENVTEKELRDDEQAGLDRSEEEMTELQDEVTKGQPQARKHMLRYTRATIMTRRQLEVIQEIEMCAELHQIMYTQCGTHRKQ